MGVFSFSSANAIWIEDGWFEHPPGPTQMITGTVHDLKMEKHALGDYVGNLQSERGNFVIKIEDSNNVFPGYNWADGDRVVIHYQPDTWHHVAENLDKNNYVFVILFVKY